MTITERVAAGCAEFSIRNADGCVMTAIFGGFCLGCQAIYGRDPLDPGWCPYPKSLSAFAITQKENDAEIVAEWQRVIAERRGVVAVEPPLTVLQRIGEMAMALVEVL